MISSRGTTIRGARAANREFVDLPVPADLGVIDPSKSPWEAFTALFRAQSIGTRLFVDSILAGTRAVPGFVDGWKAQTVIDAVFKSDASGQWVTLTSPI